MLRVIKALEEKRDRKALGLEPRHWRTPTKKIFKNESLQQVCQAIANVDSKALKKLLESNLDLNEVGEDGLTVLFFVYMEGNFPSFVKLLEKGAKPILSIDQNTRRFGWTCYPAERRNGIARAVQSL